MAKSRFEYVKLFEHHETALPNTWMVVRLDGRGFHRFSALHEFEKPNDARALELMNEAARECMLAFPDIVLAYGESDEMSFVLDRRSNLFKRRKSKVMSTIVSLFSSTYVMRWSRFMRDKEGRPIELQACPHFDARVVCYPTLQNLKDYLSWRQADCHINNLYNTAFWLLVLKKGLTEQEAESRLRGTFSADKNEIMFSECGVNYNNEPAMFRKGSVILWADMEEEVTGQRTMPDGTTKTVTSTRRRRQPVVTAQDMIGPAFWEEHADVFAVETLDCTPGAGSASSKPRRKKAKHQAKKKAEATTHDASAQAQAHEEPEQTEEQQHGQESVIEAKDKRP
ncbi:tRNA(His) guanylyltransferase [Salpingoeca rosetta]|uniref:tRNA(His) guanylyltransferase n=1 Tax=Salpingoeca rosetta (strain ATCC 50818 / BSB-021) TaxID=946362 RepID=F2UJ88_SALR5|nr:tRNA(His) guanylyltransferase [Salpingoeca rosetta]EGD77187.1 tRNA(His) guanylyltransferase [Salpingoeca rosetta]|eukprot:XP_004990531.1 tRNA(His) guanylyltransferase [Salpingoeca rosetta]